MPSDSENAAIVVSTTDISDASVTNPDGSHFEVRFALLDQFNNQPSIRYSVRLTETTTVKGVVNDTLVDELWYDDALSVASKKPNTKEFFYPKPVDGALGFACRDYQPHEAGY